MPWTNFIQTMLFFLAGAWVYSVGKASASLLAPFSNIIERASEYMHRRQERQNGKPDITPAIRS